MSRIVMLTCCACALSVCWADAAWAQKSERPRLAGPSHVVTPREADSVSKIHAALGEKTKMDFTETQLSDVVNYLRDFHHIEIQLDTKALEDASLGPETPVSRQLEGITLRSALRLMLSGLDLTYVVEDEVLLITTPDKASIKLTTKVYPVGDLLATSEGGFKALTQAIRSTIRPNSWAAVGGPADVVCVPEARALVVMQVDEAQQDIAELLAELRKARDAQPQQVPAVGSRPVAADEQAVFND